MIKFSSILNGKQIIGLGLTEENISRLKEGQPIYIPAEVINQMTAGSADAGIILMYGKTHADIIVQLAPLIGDQTKINIG